MMFFEMYEVEDLETLDRPFEVDEDTIPFEEWEEDFFFEGMYGE